MKAKMLVAVTLGLGAVGSVCFISCVRAQAVPNGDFETPRVTGFQYSISGGSFTFVGGNGGHGSAFVGGTGISAAGSLFTYANPGNTSQVAFLQGAAGNFFYEDVDFAKPGHYVVCFDAAARGHGSSTHGGSDHEDFNVLVRGKVVGTFEPSAIDYVSFTTSSFWVTCTNPITLEFQGVDSAGDDETAFIDNVSIEQARFVKREPLTR